MSSPRIDAWILEHDGITYRVYYCRDKAKGRRWYFTVYDHDTRELKRFLFNASLYNEIFRVPEKNQHLVAMQLANEMKPKKVMTLSHKGRYGL